MTVYAKSDLNARNHLLDQVNFADKRNNYSLVKQSLDKLDLINPDDPKVLLAWVNYAVKTHNKTLETQKINRLQRYGVNTPELVQAKTLIALNTPKFKNTLLQARRLAGAGKIVEASHIYQTLFSNQPPADLALEYWTILAYNPATQSQALQALNSIDGGKAVIDKINQFRVQAPTTQNKSNPLMQQKEQYSQQLLKSAQIAVKKQQWDKAQQYFSQVLQLNASNRIAQQGLIQIRLEQQQQQIATLKHQIQQLTQSDQLNQKIALQKKILNLQTSEIWNHYDLAMSYVQQNQIPQANAIFSQYFKQYPDAKNEQKNQYVYALYLNNTNQIDTALQQLNDIAVKNRTKDTQKLYQQIITSITLRDLTEQAKQLEQQNQFDQLVMTRQKILQLQPENVWAIFDLARAYLNTQQQAKADTLFLDSKLQHDAQYYYAYALYLYGTQRYQQALNALDQIDVKHQDDKVKSLILDLQVEQRYQDAQQFWDSGKTTQAIEWVNMQPESLRKHALLADWYLALQNMPLAEKHYQQVLAVDPKNINAQFGLASIYLYSQPKKSKQIALNLYQIHFDKINEKRKLAKLLLDLKLSAQANQLYSELSQQNWIKPSEDMAILKNDLAKWHVIENRKDQALREWKQAMYLAQITRQVPENNDDFTQFMQLHADDDWLKQDIKQSASQVYRQQERSISSGLNYSYYDGTDGSSHVDQTTFFLQAQFPLADGRAVLQANWSDFNAGNFNQQYPHWAACTTTECANLQQQQQTLKTLAFGWKNKQWDIDLGSISSQTKNIDLLGGVRYNNTWNNINYQAIIERRRLSNSLLSYYGQTDPLTGIQWGSIHADQLALKTSYALNTRQGLWSSIDIARLTGNHVVDNSRLRSSLGYYNNLINQDQQKITTGVDFSFWHYNKNLGAYTLGQGGYYSPQRYYSLGIPIEWQKSTSQWSWGLKSRLSYSYAQSEDMQRYPLKQLVNQNLTDLNAIEAGKTSQGFGYSLKAFAEKRMTPHWFIGTALNLQYQKDYVPSNMMIYLKYSIDGWNGNMNLPVQQPALYIDQYQ